MQQVIHYFLHFVFPVFIAWFFFKNNWRKVYAVFLSTMLMDLDHLWAVPVFDACRCSVGFHPLHSYAAIWVYLFLLIPKKTRVLAIGLLMHICVDSIDCLFSIQNCQ